MACAAERSGRRCASTAEHDQAVVVQRSVELPMTRSRSGESVRRHIAGDWPVERRYARENAVVSLKPRWPIVVTEPNTGRQQRLG